MFNNIKQKLYTIYSRYKRNPYRQLPAWEYQKKLVLSEVKVGDIVLDIGSGNNPIPRADILADFFPDDNFHRSGNISETKPLVVCSVERLPFKERAVDFVLCSHILEHVDSPIRAGKELATIAKAGYVETPAYGKDVLIGSGYMHKWQVVEFSKKLYFFEYSKRQESAHVTSPVMKLWVQEHYHPWQDYFWERQDIFNACLLWKDKIEIIEHRYSKSIELNEWMQVPQERLIKSAPNLSAEEINILEKCLAAPDHKSQMVFKGDRFEDATGKYIYPVRGKRIYCEMAVNNVK